MSNMSAQNNLCRPHLHQFMPVHTPIFANLNCFLVKTATCRVGLAILCSSKSDMLKHTDLL
jgi:hypothetical protein